MYNYGFLGPVPGAQSWARKPSRSISGGGSFHEEYSPGPDDLSIVCEPEAREFLSSDAVRPMGSLVIDKELWEALQADIADEQALQQP